MNGERDVQRIQDEIDTGRLDEIERTALEWIADHSTDPVARTLATRVFERLDDDEDGAR